MNQHRSNVSRGYLKHSVSRQAATHHDCSFNDFVISAIEPILADAHNRMELLSRWEMYWIFKLDTFIPNGLNEPLEQVY